MTRAGMQAMVESLLSEFPNVLTLRVRMPIVADMTYPRNFITKIIKYDKVTLEPAPQGMQFHCGICSLALVSVVCIC